MCYFASRCGLPGGGGVVLLVRVAAGEPCVAMLPHKGIAAGGEPATVKHVWRCCPIKAALHVWTRAPCVPTRDAAPTQWAMFSAGVRKRPCFEKKKGSRFLCGGKVSPLMFDFLFASSPVVLDTRSFPSTHSDVGGIANENNNTIGCWWYYVFYV